MRLKRPMYHDKTEGKDVQIFKWGIHNYEDELLPKPITGFTPQFGPQMYEALKKVVQPREGIPASGDIGQATADVLWGYIPRWKKAEYLAWKIPTVPKPNPLPDLGPLCNGGASVLLHQLTHNTDGILNFPAYDDGWAGGRSVYAVEDMIVDTKQTSSSPGAAFYATGKSKIRYWYGHLVSSPPLGHEFKKGQTVGHILTWQRSHVHLGVDARALIGHSLLFGANGYGPDYTYGSPAVGVQISESLSL